MQPNDMMAPPSPEEAFERESQPAEDTQNGDSAYRGAEVRCYNCANFTEPSTCSKNVNGGQVDPEGGCSQFAMASDDEGGEEDEAAEAEGDFQAPGGFE